MLKYGSILPVFDFIMERLIKQAEEKIEMKFFKDKPDVTIWEIIKTTMGV